MADKSILDDAALRIIHLSPSDGETMIAISRAILSGHYSTDEFNEDFFIIFIAIDDQSDHIILDGFGEFNTASARFMISGNRLRDLLKVSFGNHKIDARSNTIIYQAEIRDIYETDYDNFLECFQQFRLHFNI
jgi:hypothetical protein